MNVYEIREEHCFGSALVAADHPGEATQILEEWDGLGNDLNRFFIPSFRVYINKDLEYKGDTPKVLHGYFDY